MHNVAPLWTEQGSWEVDKVLDSTLAANGNESLNASVLRIPVASREERKVKHKTPRKLNKNTKWARHAVEARYLSDWCYKPQGVLLGGREAQLRSASWLSWIYNKETEARVDPSFKTKVIFAERKMQRLSEFPPKGLLQYFMNYVKNKLVGFHSHSCIVQIS